MRNGLSNLEIERGGRFLEVVAEHLRSNHTPPFGFAEELRQVARLLELSPYEGVKLEARAMRAVEWDLAHVEKALDLVRRARTA